MASIAVPSRIVLDDDDEIENANAEEAVIKSDHKWESFNLKPEIVKGIYSVGFDTPSFIQKKAIPIIMSKRDLRAQAQSGTGKTGAFVIGTLQRIDESVRATQCLVLAPTREIAKQNATKFQEIGAYMNISVCALLGGTSVKNDLALLSRKPHIVVGTPGRIVHMLTAGSLSTESISIFILDEADSMLRDDFLSAVKEIYLKLSCPNLQTLLFSATYDPAVIDVVKNMVESPVEIDLRNEDQTLQGIKQLYVSVGMSACMPFTSNEHRGEVSCKVATFVDIFKDQTLSQVLVFMNRKSDSNLVHQLLNEAGYPCSLISSDLTQEEREQTLENFKMGKARILVSSGLCDRGIDVQALSLVVCFDVPQMSDRNNYIHRIGRSGRYGRKGIALHILTDQELEQLHQIAAHFNSVITPLQAGFNFKQ
ncbi:hypothetical protein PAPHI01_1649 [Pancytospora philotis]|nr:hypothetical protein PAPHI01_1649 [Pancytospora philotis]